MRICKNKKKIKIKLKVLILSRHGFHVEMTIKGGGLQEVEEFTYLRNKKTSDGRSKKKVTGLQ